MKAVCRVALDFAASLALLCFAALLFIASAALVPFLIIAFGCGWLSRKR